MAPKLMEDESGVNILIEYVMNFAITLILFTIVLLTYQSLMTQSNNNVTEEQLKIIANDIANKITAFDNVVSSSSNNRFISSTYGSDSGTINSLSQTFNMQSQISGHTYYIDIYYNGPAPSDGYVVAHTSDTNIVPVKASFRTNHPVDATTSDPITIQSASLTHMISYMNGKIEVDYVP